MTNIELAEILEGLAKRLREDGLELVPPRRGKGWTTAELVRETGVPAKTVRRFHLELGAVNVGGRGGMVFKTDSPAKLRSLLRREQAERVKRRKS